MARFACGALFSAVFLPLVGAALGRFTIEGSPPSTEVILTLIVLSAASAFGGWIFKD